MDFRAIYLQAMRYQAPAMFKRLSRSGELHRVAATQARAAERMFRELTADAPKDKDGQPTLQAMREAEELVRADLLVFEGRETSPEEDEAKALRGDRPILSPERTT
jgi:predicted ATPase